MCGIFGYVGDRTDAPKIVFEGLKTLEYRGYDSWGIAVRKSEVGNRKSEIIVEKRVGKLPPTLNSQLSTFNSNVALGHTRWATHGGVIEENAHPHTDCSGKISAVHNGIVENWEELKKSLSKNHHFKSQTDTEVLIASDSAGLLPFTDRAVFIKDGEMAVISKKNVRIINAQDGKNQKVQISQLSPQKDTSSKDDKFPHIMLSEIYDKPNVL